MNFAEVSAVWPSILRKACVSSLVVAPVVPESREKIYAVKRIFAKYRAFKRVGHTMKPLELKPEDQPIIVKLKTQDGTKDYVLLMTKQEKLLLNKPMGGARG